MTVSDKMFKNRAVAPLLATIGGIKSITNRFPTISQKRVAGEPPDYIFGQIEMGLLCPLFGRQNLKPASEGIGEVIKKKVIFTAII